LPTGEHRDPEVLVRLLRLALRAGCRASRLVLTQGGRDLIDQVTKDEDETRSLYERALVAEHLLTSAISTYGSPTQDVLAVLLGLAPGSHGRPLKDRRRIAADILDVLPDTFRRHYEARLMWDVAFALLDISPRPAP
jgi:hypothetical protein